MARAKRPAQANEDFIFGLHAVTEVLSERAESVLDIWGQLGRDDARMHKVLQLAHDVGIRVQDVGRDSLDRLTDGARHQGVVIRCRPQPPPKFNDLVEQLKVRAGDVLVLDGVSDPHNLGACLRNAAAAGAAGVVVPRSRSAPVGPTVRKVACGGAEIVPVYPVSNLVRALKQLQTIGMPIIGLAGEVEQSIYALELRAPAILVVGTEATGLRRLTREQCDHLVKIPMAGRMESLNMSVATGIALFELARQRSSVVASGN